MKMFESDHPELVEKVLLNLQSEVTGTEADALARLDADIAKLRECRT